MKLNQAQQTNFAFAYGVRLVLETVGPALEGEDILGPLLSKIERITASPRNSMIKAHDDCDLEEVRQLRELEQEICADYLDKVQTANG